MLDKCLAILLLGCVSIGVSGCDTQPSQSVLVVDGTIKVYDIYGTYKELVFTAPATAELESRGSSCYVNSIGKYGGRTLPFTCEYIDNLITKSKGV
jgi:hypothetical protein